MKTEKSRKAAPKGKATKKILIFVPALAVALILLVLLFVPVFVSSEKGRETVLAKINSLVDGQANFDTLSMGWSKGIKVTDISYSDSVGQTSIHIKQIATKPHYASILLGSLSFGETIIDQPQIEINLKHRHTEKTTGPAYEVSVEKSKPTALPIKKINLIVNNGNLKVTDSKAETIELSQINSHIDLHPPGQQTNFDMDLTVPGKDKESKIRAAGRITPKRRTPWSLKGTSGELTIKLNNLDLGSLGPIFTLAGIDVDAKGSISANIKSQIKDGRVENLTGTIKAGNLDVTAGKLKPDRLKTNTLDVDIKLQSQNGLIKIDKLKIHSDWAEVEATGAVPTTFKSLADFVKADSKYNLKGTFDLDLAAISSQIPHTLGLKDQMKVTSGKLTGTVDTQTLDSKRKIYCQAKLDGLKGLVDGKPIALSQPVKAEAEITAEKDSILFDKVDISASFAKIDCAGSTESLKYTANVDLAELQAELGQFVALGHYQLAGKILARNTMSFKQDKLEAVGLLVVKELHIISADRNSVSEPRVNMDYSLLFEPSKTTLNINSIKAETSFADIDIKDAVVPFGEKATGPVNLPISAKVDLAKVKPFAVMFVSFPKKMQMAGTVESDIFIGSEKATYHIKTDSTKIKNLKISYPEKEPFEQEQVSLVFDGRYNPSENNWLVRKLQLISPDIKIKGDFEKDVEGGKTRLQGRFDCEYDWSAISTAAAPFLPRGLKIHGKRKDTLSFASEYTSEQPEKLLANLNTKGKIGFDKANYMGLNLGPTEMNIRVQNGLLKVAPFSTTVNNGQFNLAGHADFKKKPALFKTPGPIQIAKDIQINDETTRKLLMYVNPVFANAVNVSGVANFNCEKLTIPLAGDSKNEIEVIGTISIDQLRLQASDLLGQILSTVGTSRGGEIITIHPTRFALQKGFLRYENMQMDIGNNPVNFKGVVGLDKSLDMRVTLPYTSLGRTVRVGEDTIGERITLPLKGTVDKPELDVAKLLEEQLKQQLKDGLREALEELFK